MVQIIEDIFRAIKWFSRHFWASDKPAVIENQYGCGSVWFLNIYLLKAGIRLAKKVRPLGRTGKGFPVTSFKTTRTAQMRGPG